jgi:hypothetical protein
MFVTITLQVDTKALVIFSNVLVAKINLLLVPESVCICTSEWFTSRG